MFGDHYVSCPNGIHGWIEDLTRKGIYVEGSGEIIRQQEQMNSLTQGLGTAIIMQGADNYRNRD